MNHSVSNRHESDLGGQLSPFGSAEQVGVTIEVPGDVAELTAVQHTAWMLVNLLARFDGVVRRVGIHCPRGVRMSQRVIPLAAKNLDFATALVVGGNEIGVVPIEAGASLDQVVRVGSSAVAGDAPDLFAIGSGWCGGISVSRPDLMITDSPLPMGPYIAACIAAGEVFKAARMRPGSYQAPQSAFYSCWEHRSSDRFISHWPRTVEIALGAALTGVGAVGCGAMHTLWACPGLSGSMGVIDNDPLGVDLTNLNRYCIFGRSAEGKPKASYAAHLLSGAPVNWLPHDGDIESYLPAAPRVLSAVDRNTARSAIQNQYHPRNFSASTQDLRAEVLRCGPPGVGACLRCFNEPEKTKSDDELRSEAMSAHEAELAAMAKSAGVTLSEAKEWLASGKCGMAGERLLPFLRRSNDEPAFAVSFVSVMAGVMLAAELLKDHLAHRGPLSESSQRATFQFFSPLARSNRSAPFLRDPRCPMCDPESIACQIWSQRYRTLLR